MENVKYLLKEINILRQRIKDEEEHEDNFNLFEIMRNRKDERYLHSRFLSVLFDPHGSHKMKDTFVRLFIEKLDLPFEYNLSSIEVYPNEKDTGEHKYIDILLIDRKRKSAVIIENKIGARDSNHTDEGQLERYYRIITQEEGIPKETTFVVYLSIDRESPSEDSIGKSKKFPELKDKVLSIHYGVEILDWLRICVKESYNRPILRESITQYIKLLENMTNNNTSEEHLKSLMSLVGKNGDNIMSAKFLIDNAIHMHWWVIFEFWKLLSERFVDSGYSIRQRIENDLIDDLVHGSATKRNKADFHLKLSTADGIDFTINADHDNYICVGVMNDDLKSGHKTKAKDFVNNYKDSFNLDSCDGWLFYKFIDFENTAGLYLSDFSDELTFSMISESRRKDIVEIIIKQVCSLLKPYKKCLK